jgi:hypothetical protein
LVETGWRNYHFRSIPAAATTEDIREFVVRMRRALRAAHGLSIPLRLRWSSGASGGVELSVDHRIGVRWMQFGLSSAYELGQWHAVSDDRRDSNWKSVYAVTLAGRTELPLPAGLEDLPWCESVLGELGTTPEGVVVEWELQPDPEAPVRQEWGSTENRRDPEIEGERAPALPERALRDRRAARRIGLHWRIRGQILDNGRPGSRGATARLAHLIEIASQLDGGNRFVCKPIRRALSWLAPAAVVSEAELVGIFPPPFLSASNPPTTNSVGQAHLWLGRDLKGACVGLPFEPRQGRHLLVLGETGMGKSSLLVRLAWQAVRWGSVVLFDPIGDTARSFLAGIPDSQAPHASWFSPSVPSLTLNLLQEVASTAEANEARRERLLGDVVGALRRVRVSRYAESSYWGPRLEEMLFQAIRAASRWPGASLAVAEQLLTPEGFPWRTVPEPAREAVGDVRRRIERAPQDGDGARRLLSEITRSEVLREMLDAGSPTWSVGEAIAPGRMTAISGDAPQVGESVARYLLAVVLALAWNAVLVRKPPSKTFLILDEAQWYAHDSVAEMLRLGRRFNLHVWAVTQSLASLPEVVRGAFTTNSADLVLFRGDPSDVRDVSRWVPRVAPERIMRMPRGEAAVLIDKGSDTHWIQLSPLAEGRGDPDRFRPVAARGSPQEPAQAILQPSGPVPGEVRQNECGDRTEGANPLLEVLRASLDSPDIGPEFTVHLSDLRSRWPTQPTLAERWVRNGGRLLAAMGAILRSGRDDAGTFWVLSRKRLASALSSEEGDPNSRGGASVGGTNAADPSQDEAI